MPQKILIVDDNDRYRDFLREVFEEAKHTVIEADGSESALAQIQAGCVPDAAIIDLIMPDSKLDGIQLIEVMRKDLAIPYFLHSGADYAESRADNIPDVRVVEKTIDGIRSILAALDESRGVDFE